MKKLVILGGGHAHVEVLRQFGVERLAGVDITLVNPGRHAAYSGMLPGLIAGHYTWDECHIDLQPLTARAGARRVDARALSLNAAQRVLRLDSGEELGYDVLSIDVGSTPITGNVAGVDEHAIAVKPVDAFLAAWTQLQQQARAGGIKRIAVVGGGAAGVEVLLAMQHQLTQHAPRAAVATEVGTEGEFVLVTDTPRLLPRHAAGVRRVLERNLARKHVTMRTGVVVTAVERGALLQHGAGDERIAADAVLWITGAAPPQWLANSGLALNDGQFLNINKYLHSTSHAEVFAAGDCATIAGASYPKSGVYAVRQGPVLAQNLSAYLAGAPLSAYTPQPRALALISTGEKHAIASYGALSFHGNWVWRWKDGIDRKFMARYRV